MAQELLRREAIQPTKQIKPIQQMSQVQLIETADRILGKETPRSQVKKRAEEFISILSQLYKLNLTELNDLDEKTHGKVGVFFGEVTHLQKERCEELESVLEEYKVKKKEISLSNYSSIEKAKLEAEFAQESISKFEKIEVEFEKRFLSLLEKYPPEVEKRILDAKNILITGGVIAGGSAAFKFGPEVLHWLKRMTQLHRTQAAHHLWRALRSPVRPTGFISDSSWKVMMAGAKHPVAAAVIASGVLVISCIGIGTAIYYHKKFKEAEKAVRKPFEKAAAHLIDVETKILDVKAKIFELRGGYAREKS